MTPDNIRAVLSTWHESMQECEERMDQLAAVAGPVVESPLGDAVYHLMGKYTKAVADQIGWCDDTLSAWWVEHQFGGRPMSIGFCGEQMRSIATIEQLADFIIHDLQRASA